ncbi:MAG: ATP synthase F1 subunit gamma [Candidatus Palauibacterales bacterium]|nr:ATP synthase F1 subunit gamma [Candidatus Palauibacterales bacterium]
MANAREIKRRIGSIESTKTITRTMEMVAASKLRRARQRVEEARPYADRLSDVIRRLVSPELAEVEPLLRQPERIDRAAVVLLTSNRGLCGPFNSNLIREARDILGRLEDDGVERDFHVVGSEGIDYFSFRDVEMERTRTDIEDSPTVEDARSMMEPLAEEYVAEEIDAVYIVAARFESVMETPPTTRQVLPVHVPDDRDGGGRFYILDPSDEEILSELLPLYVVNTMYRSLVETAAAEQGARRRAMKDATDNAEEMLDELQRSYNRARQAEITQQIAEIMGGAEALEE